jgi:hypothetical protein
MQGIPQGRPRMIEKLIPPVIQRAGFLIFFTSGN